MNVFLSKKQQILHLQGKPGTEETTMLQSVVLIMRFHQVKAQLSLKASYMALSEAWVSQITGITMLISLNKLL